jgi:hypothetical protein
LYKKKKPARWSRWTASRLPPRHTHDADHPGPDDPCPRAHGTPADGLDRHRVTARPSRLVPPHLLHARGPPACLRAREHRQSVSRPHLSASHRRPIDRRVLPPALSLPPPRARRETPFFRGRHHLLAPLHLRIPDSSSSPSSPSRLPSLCSPPPRRRAVRGERHAGRDGSASARSFLRRP